MPDDLETIYQYASGTTWPTTDGGWTADRAVRLTSVSDGSSLAAGDARGHRRYGRLRQPWQTTVADDPLPTSHPSLGRYVRLLRADAGGAITYDSRTWTAFWWGFCASIRTRYAGTQSGLPATGIADYHLAGLAALLAEIYVIDGWDGNVSASHPWNTFHGTPFNRGGKGNRTSATWTIHHRAVRVFETHSAGQLWTVATAIDYLLEAFTERHGGGSTWTLVDDSTRGATVLPPTTCHGKTLLALLTEIANPRNGLCFRAEVDPSTNRPRLRLLDWPESPGQAIDASSRLWEVEIEEDTLTASDHALVLSAAPPTTTTTFTFATSGSQTLAADGWTFGAPTPDDPQDLVLRRFTLSTAVIDALRVDLVTDIDDAYDGTRQTAADIGGGPSARDAELDRQTGLSAGQKTSTIAVLADEGERGKARVLVRAGAGSTTWEDWSDKANLSVTNHPARIHLHMSDADRLDLYRILTTGGGELRLTLGVRELATLRLSARLPDLYRGTREVLRQVGGVNEHTVAAGAAVAVNAGALVTASAAVSTWDGAISPMTDELVRLIAARQTGRRVSLSLAKRELDFATLPPGSTIETVDGGAGAITVQCGVTRRTWDLVNRRTIFDSLDLREAQE